jgi:hypothetical protein
MGVTALLPWRIKVLTAVLVALTCLAVGVGLALLVLLVLGLVQVVTAVTDKPLLLLAHL